jgi:2-(1,2-epoxy-1,2-dihydrophenyl)acetyl-CoA isomerase
MIGKDARADLSFEGPVAVITLVREAQLNAFDAAMHAALSSSLDVVCADPSIRVLVMTGKARAFSSGQDLGERAAAFAAGDLPDIHGSLEKLYNPLVRRIAQLPFPVIAAVNGMAFGAGAALAIACDITLAAQSARFQFGFVNVGLGPDSGASWTLPRRVGSQRAMDLMLSARPVPGDEAERIGLVARCIDDDLLLPEALALAHKLASQSPDALRTIKQRLRAAVNLTLDDALDAERDAQALLGKTTYYRDAVLRFAARAQS